MIHYRTSEGITLLCGPREEFIEEIRSCCKRVPSVHVYSPDASLSSAVAMPNCFLTRTLDASKRLLFLVEGHVFLDYSGLYAPSRIRMRNILVSGTTAKSCKVLINENTLLGLLKYYKNLVLEEAKDIRNYKFYK